MMKKAIHIFPGIQLLIFPLVFLVMQVLLKLDYKWFFLSGHDPAYAFLFNGLNIANGSLQLGLSGFPGIVLQCLVALNLVCFKLISGTADLTLAVISDPEFFLNIISYEIIGFNTIALWLLGYVSYRDISNLPLSLGLQLTPFISLKAFTMNSVVMLEPFLLCTELLILIPVVRYTFLHTARINNRIIIMIALLMALGITTKTVFLPLLFLPLFALEGFRKKLLYGLLILIFTAILLIPIYPTFSSFLSWYKLILTHLGPYGSGKAGLFDPAVYIDNLVQVFRSNILFTIAFVSVALVMPGMLRHDSGNRIPAHKKHVLAGLFFAFLINILMVARHYSLHYLVVSYNLSIFAFLVIISLLPEKFTGVFSEYRFRTLLVFFGGSLLVYTLVIGIQFSPDLKNPRLKALDFVKSEVGNTQRIIVFETPGPFIETALYHGYTYSAGMMPEYAPVLKQLHPAVFFFNPGQDRLHDWVNDCSLEYLLSRSPSTYVYCALKTDTLPPKLGYHINKLKKEGFIQSVNLKYTDSIYSDRIYEIRPSEKINGLFNPAVTIHEDSRVIRLNEFNPFGGSIKIVAQKGFYEITALRNSADKKGSIVAADSTGSFYRSNAVSLERSRNSDLIRLVVDVPDNLVGQKLSIYLWYPGKKQCAFKEFKIDYICRNN